MILFWNDNFAASTAEVHDDNNKVIASVPLLGADTDTQLSLIASLIQQYGCKKVVTNDSRNRFLEPNLNNKLNESYDMTEYVGIEVLR